jgi:hypothetical protein
MRLTSSMESFFGIFLPFLSLLPEPRRVPLRPYLELRPAGPGVEGGL